MGGAGGSNHPNHETLGCWGAPDPPHVARKRDKWVPNIAYFCAMVLRTHCMGHCSGLYGKYGIPVRGGSCTCCQQNAAADYAL